MSASSRSGGGVASGPRFNKKPALIAVAFIGLFLVGMMYAAYQRSNQQLPDEETGTVFDMGTSGEAIDFLEDKPDGLVGVNRNDIGEPKTPKPEGDDYQDKLSTWLQEREFSQLQQQSEVRDRMEAKQLEEYESAMRSSSKVETIEPREKEEAPVPDVTFPAAQRGPEGGYVDPAAAQLAANGQTGSASGAPTPDQMAALMQQFGGGGGGSESERERDSTNTDGVQQGQQFVGQQAPEQNEFVLEERAQAPRSPYELKTGAIISGAMISAANSDLPGDMLAQVTKDVYDSASGRFVVIPQGTKLFGRYDAYTALGQERLLIVWNRLVFPDGETLDIGGMQGYDSRGLAGFKDRVNTHFLRTLGNALLISVVNASGEALIDSVSGDDESESTFNIALAQDFADTTTNAFNEYLQNRLRIKPTLEIRSGYQFNIIVSKDIDFDGPYERGFDAYRSAQ